MFYVGGCEEASNLECKIAVIAYIEKSRHNGVHIHCSEEGHKVAIGIAHIVLDMKCAHVAAENAECLILRHFLHIGVARIPNGVKQRVIYAFDHAK